MNTAAPNGVAVQAGFRFGDFQYDPARHELRKNGTRIRLQRQPMAILLMLLESPGVLVRREELRGRLWGEETFVGFEQGLNSAVKRLRDALCDSAESPRYVETVPGEGYRFIGEVQRLPPLAGISALNVSEDADVLQPSPETRTARGAHLFGWRSLRWALLSLAVVATAAIVWRFASHRVVTSVSLAAQQMTFNSPELATTAGAISPDGRYLAYADSAGVFIRDLYDPGLSERRIAEAKVAQSDLSWTYNGTALLAWGEGGIWKINALSGEIAPLLSRGGAMTASPAENLAAVLCTVRSMCIVDINSGGLLKEFSDTDTSAHWGRPTWSPDGKWIAFVRRWQTKNGTDGAIDIYSLDGTERARAWEGLPLKGDLEWNTAGILFSRGRKPPEGRFDDMWFVPLNARQLRANGPGIPVTAWPGFTFHSMSQTSDGNEVVFLRAAIRLQISVAEVSDDGRALHDLHPLAANSEDNFITGWADENTVFFDTAPNQTAVVAEQGLADERPRTPWFAEASTSGAVRTPAGSVVYVAESSSTVMRADPDGTRTRRLSFSDNALIKLRCPAKTKMCFAKVTEGKANLVTRKIVMFDPADLAPGTVLLNSDAQIDWWDVDPEGQRIAITDSNHNTVDVFDLYGRKIETIPLSGPGRLMAAAFTQNGRGLFATFLNGNGGRAEYVSQKKRKVLWQSNSISLQSPTLSPDGHHLAFRSSTVESNVWLAKVSEK